MFDKYFKEVIPAQDFSCKWCGSPRVMGLMTGSESGCEGRLSALLEERPPVWLQSAGELVSCSQTLGEGDLWPTNGIGASYCLEERDRAARELIQAINRHVERLEEGR